MIKLLHDWIIALFAEFDLNPLVLFSNHFELLFAWIEPW